MDICELRSILLQAIDKMSARIILELKRRIGELLFHYYFTF